MAFVPARTMHRLGVPLPRRMSRYERLIEALVAGPLSRTEMRDLFGRHVAGITLDELLERATLERGAFPVVLETGGRPRTVWRLSA